MRPWSANPRWITSFDDFPLDSVEVKGELFARAAEESWLVALSHEPVTPIGRLTPGPRPVPLRPRLTSGARLSAMFRMAVGHSDDIDLDAALATVFEQCEAALPVPRRRPGS